MSIHEPTLQSPLDAAHDDYDGRPFFGQTLSLLRSIRDHGAAVGVPTRTEWEDWFHQLFAGLDAVGADTDSEILDYVAIEGASLGYSVLDFRQFLTKGGRTATFDCLATITWARTATGWREARWQASVVSSDVPAGFGDQP